MPRTRLTVRPGAVFGGESFLERSCWCRRRWKTDPGRRLKIDPPRHGLLREGGPYAGGGGSGGDPGLETAGQEYSQDCADAEPVTKHGAALSAWRGTAAVSA